MNQLSSVEIVANLNRKVDAKMTPLELMKVKVQRLQDERTVIEDCGFSIQNGGGIAVDYDKLLDGLGVEGETELARIICERAKIAA